MLKPNRTPPLPALRAFAALVRLGSVAAAAEELKLTASAISHQIRALEQFLAVPLVERAGRSLVLTEAGRAYGHRVRQALHDIAEATDRIMQPSPTRGEQVVRLSLPTSFAQGWLLSRLPRFLKQHPKIRLSLQGTMADLDLSKDQADCAIRFGHGHWPDATAVPLMGEHVMVLGAPGLLGKRAFTKLDALLCLPQLHATESWPQWLASIPGSDLLSGRLVAHIDFNEETQLLEAARLGLGLALSRRAIADSLLSQGALVRAFAHVCEHACGYYFMVPQHTPPNKARDALLSWLQRECTQFVQARDAA